MRLALTRSISAMEYKAPRIGRRRMSILRINLFSVRLSYSGASRSILGCLCPVCCSLCSTVLYSFSWSIEAILVKDESKARDLGMEASRLTLEQGRRRAARKFLRRGLCRFKIPG